MPSKLQKAIGAVKDQTSISLAKVASNSSSNLDVAVLKATTHDDIPIDERYVPEVLDLVSFSKVYAAACARAIGKRIGRTRNWIVALKSLMLVLRIFQDGDPYFPREVLHAMKRGAKILNLSSFRDDSNSSPWDFTAFVRTFALYLDERLDCFLMGKLQRRYNHREKMAAAHQRSRRTSDLLRELKPTILLDRISYWQRLLERAIATRPTGNAKHNRLVQICLYAVVQETFDLYKDISDGLALLLDSFFHLQYQNCVNAFQTCIKASKQFEELNSFYSLCKSIGVGRTSEYPSVQSISEELMETLQEFLKDKSSFPANDKQGNNLMLLPRSPQPNNISSDRRPSYAALSEFSETSDRYSERSSEFGSRSEFGSHDFGSQGISLEDLISATETQRTPSISIELEDYSEQFDKKLQPDGSFVFCETGSTHSLPVSSSMADFVSLDEWPDADEKQEQEKEAQQQNQNQEHELQEKKQEPQESSFPGFGWELVLPEKQQVLQQKQNQDHGLQVQKQGPKFPGMGWELVLDEAMGMHTQPNASDGFDALEQVNLPNKQETDAEDNSRTGWELVLFETTAQSMKQIPPPANAFDLSSLDSLYNQASGPANYYNPFFRTRMN